jgi:hypothetical protein
MSYVFRSSSILTCNRLAHFDRWRSSYSHIMFFVVHLGQIADYTLIKILSSQMGIPGCGEDFKNAVLDLKKRYVERSSS